LVLRMRTFRDFARNGVYIYISNNIIFRWNMMIQVMMY
jgi:hypothetical protein